MSNLSQKGGLSSAFKGCVKTDNDFRFFEYPGMSANQAAETQAPAQSTFSTISGQNFSVNATAITGVNANQGNALGAAQNVQAQTSSVKAQTSFVKGNIADTITQMQREVRAVMNEIGIANEPIFIQRTSSDADVFVNAAFGGGASAEMMNLLSACQDVRSSVPAGERQAMIDKLVDALASRANPNPGPVMLTPSYNPQAGQDQSQFNWGGVDKRELSAFIETLMTADPNNPPRSLCPEWYELDDIEHAMDELANNAVAIERHIENNNPAADVDQAQQNLAAIHHCAIPAADIDADTARCIASLTPPEDMRRPPPKATLGMQA